MNKPTASKINYSGLLLSALGAASYYDVIPRGAEGYIAEFIMIGGGALIVVFRTWFTDKSDA